MRSVRAALELIHSSDQCPKCPATFQQLWDKLEEGPGAPPLSFVVEVLAYIAATMVDDLGELELPEDPAEKFERARMRVLHRYAGEFLLDLHR